MPPLFSTTVIDEFAAHTTAMRENSRARREAVQLRAVVDDDQDGLAVDIKDTLGVHQPQDKWAGCTNLRTLRTLLSIVDDRGFERSPHQMAFHSSFERCVSRVIYKRVRVCQYRLEVCSLIHVLVARRRTGLRAGRRS